MHLALQPHRLVSRGEAGLACEASGLAFGGVELVRLRFDAQARARCEVRSPSETRRIVEAAYGQQPDASNEAEREKMGGFLPLHNQSHDLYNRGTAARIDAIRQNFPPELTPVRARAILEAVALRNWLDIMRGKYNPVMKVGE